MALTKITSTNIGANAVTSSSIGYTPANKAGDTITGDLTVSANLTTTVLTVKTGDAPIAFKNASGNTFWNMWPAYNDGNFYIASRGAGNPVTPSTSDLLYIYPAGQLRVPNQPAFHAYGNQSSLANGGTVIPGTTSVNINSCYNTSNGRFTAPVSGTYAFMGTLDWNGATNGYYYGFEFRKNNSTSNVGQGMWQIAQGSNDNSVTHCIILTLSVNDYVTMNASYQNTPSTTYSNFSGHMIG